MTQPRAPVEIANRLAIAGWVFMAIWMGFLALMTWVLHRDGPHPSQPGWLQQGAIALFWLVGQGGYGIQMAPALARFAAAAIAGRSVPTDIEDQGLAADAIGAGRLCGR